MKTKLAFFALAAFLAASSTNNVLAAENETELVVAGHVEYDISTNFGVVKPEYSSIQLNVHGSLLSKPIDERVYLDADGDFFLKAQGIYNTPYKLDIKVSDIKIRAGNDNIIFPATLSHTMTDDEKTGLRGTVTNKDGKIMKRVFYLRTINLSADADKHLKVQDVENSQETKVRLAVKVQN